MTYLEMLGTTSGGGECPAVYVERDTTTGPVVGYVVQGDRALNRQDSSDVVTVSVPPKLMRYVPGGWDGYVPPCGSVADHELMLSGTEVGDSVREQLLHLADHETAIHLSAADLLPDAAR